VATRPKIPYDVKLLLAALSLGAAAFSLLATVIGLQVFAITGSERDLGLLGLAQFLPILLLAPVTGTVADRLDRRFVYGGGLLIMTVASVGLLVYAAGNPTGVLPFLLLLLVNGVGRALGTPASRSLPIDFAPEDALERIVAVRSLTFQVARIVGPLIGAFANRVSTVLPYILIIGLQLLAVLILVFVSKPTTAKLQSDGGPRQAIRDAVEGLKFVRKSQIVLGAISLDLFAVLFGGAVALLPAIVEKRLGVEDVDLGVGILRASIAAAAALMALVLTFRPVTRRAGHWLFGVIAVFGLATIHRRLQRARCLGVWRDGRSFRPGPGRGHRRHRHPCRGGGRLVPVPRSPQRRPLQRRQTRVDATAESLRGTGPTRADLDLV